VLEKLQNVALSRSRKQNAYINPRKADWRQAQPRIRGKAGEAHEEPDLWLLQSGCEKNQKAELTIVHAIQLELVVNIALLLSFVDWSIDGFRSGRHSLIKALIE
jgi:hypothetical protein